MNEVAVIHANAVKPMSAGEIQQQVNTIQHVMKQVMKPNVHYGVIPGCKEKSLFKPGAEKIMATFRLSATPDVTDLSTHDKIHYRVVVSMVSPTGNHVGSGIGECSTDEEKYRWRSAVCQEEFDETPPDRRREKWRKGYGGRPPYKQQQIRTEPADLANTVLKMAKKRALVDGVLTATAASDCFTQDIEDLPPEYVEANTAEPEAKPPYPAEKFDSSLATWRELVETAQKTPASIIATVSSKFTLTEEQKQTINGLAPQEEESCES